MNTLPDNEIHVWDSKVDDFDFSDLMLMAGSWLTAVEHKRLQRFYFEEHKKQLLLGRLLVRRVLSRYEMLAPGQWEFCYNDYGKPSLTKQQQNQLATPLYFNLSHSRGAVVLAVAKLDDVGIDIECNTRGRRVERIAGRYFSNAETSELLALNESDRLARFYDLWSLKEAYIKARGMGLAIDLGQFSFSFPRPDKVSIEFADELGDDANCWQFWQMNSVDGFNLAVAAKSDTGQQIQRIEQFALKDLDG